MLKGRFELENKSSRSNCSSNVENTTKQRVDNIQAKASDVRLSKECDVTAIESSALYLNEILVRSFFIKVKT